MRCHGVPCTRAPVEACRGEGASACRLKVWENCDSNKIMHRGRDPEPGSGPDPKRCACILVVLDVQLPELAAERVPRLAARIRRGDKVRRGFKQQTLGPEQFSGPDPKWRARFAIELSVRVPVLALRNQANHGRSPCLVLSMQSLSCGTTLLPFRTLSALPRACTAREALALAQHAPASGGRGQW